ncbi:methyltransferase [Coccidioides immitis RMSCC 3703]|uniref:Methyltransferase n=1 Tax=Coccidioides immitis RMSCC 3703 TaxID=454286 RepID=A0A0J8R7A7_COCIT|nr:methyltransferase [Coccidioides immitis RMSCC 3703]
MAGAPTPAIDDVNNLPSIEVDDSQSDDEVYQESLSAYTASLTSSVLDYRFENNRRYHGFRDGKYLGPNDDKEADRLDTIHELMLETFNRKLFFAPIGTSPQQVLDIGTGTGIWAVDFAEKFPDAEVTGNDLSPIQPTFVPSNVKFVVEDFEDDWIEESKYDFIHGRYLAGSVQDFPRLLKQAFKYVSCFSQLPVYSNALLLIRRSVPPNQEDGSKCRIGMYTAIQRTALLRAPQSSDTSKFLVMLSEKLVVSSAQVPCWKIGWWRPVLLT